MSCDFPGTLLHAYLDGELGAVRAAEFERHLEDCRECTATLGAIESLRSSFQRAQLYETAPAELRRKIRGELKSPATGSGGSAIAAWRWLAVAAAILMVTGVAWFSLPRFRATGPESVTAAEVIDAHIRSLQPGHLTDVVSTDQHTVKPWFDGKLDFSPPVRDIADQGFPLQGGRIDVVHGRSVAALVYSRRKHFVNVFIWPTDEKDAAPRSGSQQGYQWIDWRKGRTEFCAVSDAAPSALEQLQKLFTE